MPKAEERAGEIARIIAILHRWGIHTLGQLAALPQDELAARLGPQAVSLWEQASGRSIRLLRLVRPSEIFAEQIEFEHEIETAEPPCLSCKDFSSNSPGVSASSISSSRK
jgi:protein ImuB